MEELNNKIDKTTLGIALDKNIELISTLEKKLKDFSGYLRGITIGMIFIALIQFSMILWLVLR